MAAETTSSPAAINDKRSLNIAEEELIKANALKKANEPKPSFLDSFRQFFAGDQPAEAAPAAGSAEPAAPSVTGAAPAPAPPAKPAVKGLTLSAVAEDEEEIVTLMKGDAENKIGIELEGDGAAPLIKNTFEGGLAQLSHRLHPGMEVRAVNGVKMNNHADATAAIRAAEGEVKLTVGPNGTQRGP